MRNMTFRRMAKVTGMKKSTCERLFKEGEAKFNKKNIEFMTDFEAINRLIWDKICVKNLYGTKN